jgi:predicted AAA+ superfamily ATPase
MYYPRSLKDVWLKASRQFPVLLLTGPRQVGKTTFLRHICPAGRSYITLDDPSTRALANEDPGLFMKRFSPPLLIDEIQYAPNLMPYIKMMVDTSGKEGLFWLTGSQQFVMMKGISETLAGRVAILNLLGFSQREKSRSNIDIEPFIPEEKQLAARLDWAEKPNLGQIYKNIWLGSFPALIAGTVKNRKLYREKRRILAAAIVAAAARNKNRNLYYSSYLQTYLQRDVRDLTQVGDEISFLKFIRACAARTGQLLNLADLARDADISIPTAKKWLSILRASFQVFLLQPYHSNITKRLIRTPKLYFLDTGLCSYLTEWTSPAALEAGAMSGAIFETYVFTEILKSYWHRGLEPAIYYYHDKDKKEIDFIIERNQKLYPIEVKKSTTPKKDWVSHFSALQKLKRKISSGAVICMTEKVLPIDGKNDAVPVTIL